MLKDIGKLFKRVLRGLIPVKEGIFGLAIFRLITLTKTLSKLIFPVGAVLVFIGLIVLFTLIESEAHKQRKEQEKIEMEYKSKIIV